MFNKINRKIRMMRVRRTNLILKNMMDHEVGHIRGLVEKYNYAIINGNDTASCFYEQELKEREARLNEIKWQLAV